MVAVAAGLRQIHASPMHNRQMSSLAGGCERGSGLFCGRVGRTEVFAMSQLGGLLSLFLIVAAFFTSCDSVPDRQVAFDVPGLPSFDYSED